MDQFLYYLAFGLYVLDIFLDRTTFEYVLMVPVADFQQMLQLCVLALLLVKTLVFQRATVKQWFIAVVLVALGFITWRVSANGWLFWTALFIVCGQGVQVHHLALTALIVLVPLLLLTVSCAYLGLIENKVSEHSSTGVIRTAMGFTHPNYFGFVLLDICLAFSTLRFGKIPLIDMFPIGAAFFVCIAVANSRTSALCLLILAVLLWVFYLIKSERGHSGTIVCFAFLIALVIAFSLYTMVAYTSSNSVLAQLNSLLSNRLLYAHKYYDYFGLTFLGRDYTNSPLLVYSYNAYYTFVVDNAFCQILLRFGIIAFVVFLSGIGAFYIDAFRLHRWDVILLGITLFLIFGFSEYKGIVFADNYFLIGLAEVLYRERREPVSVRVKRTSLVSTAKDPA